MPSSSYRSFVGVAPDQVNAFLQIVHAPGATTLTLRTIVGSSAPGTLAASGATWSAVIVDGENTETVALSGNLSGTTDGSTVACAATSHAHNANCYVYFQLTASIGPTAYIPVTNLEFLDDITQLKDQGYRGSQADVYGIYQGERKGSVSLDGDLFADTFGYLLSGFFGAYDYTATSGGNPTTYAFSPAIKTSTAITGNAPSQGQPWGSVFYEYNPANSNTRAYAGTRIEELTVKADPGALASWTAKGIAWKSGVVANPGTIPPVFSSVTPVPARVGTMTIGGTVTAKVLSYEVTFKRNEAEAIPTLNSIQDPLTIFVGPVSVTGKATIVIDDDVQFLNYINISQPSLLLTMNQGTSTAANGVKIQTTSANYDNGTKIQHKGKSYMQLEVPFEAIANSTDASTAGGGLSPSLVTLSTGTTTGATKY